MNNLINKYASENSGTVKYMSIIIIIVVLSLMALPNPSQTQENTKQTSTVLFSMVIKKELVRKYCSQHLHI